MAGIEKDQNGGNEDTFYNIFRDSPLRYCGYANEVGESFRYQIPRFVGPSYILAFGYCASDAIFAGYRKWSEDLSSIPELKVKSTDISPEKRVAVAALDTLLWQTFASVLIPGGTINLIVRATRFGVMRSSAIPATVKKWGPTVSGLISIPFIVHPIDNFVDLAMDKTTRSWWKNYSSSN